jgi:hypothetical protein
MHLCSVVRFAFADIVVGRAVLLVVVKVLALVIVVVGSVEVVVSVRLGFSRAAAAVIVLQAYRRLRHASAKCEVGEGQVASR